jgi:hypothetical protein
MNDFEALEANLAALLTEIRTGVIKRIVAIDHSH